MEELTYAQNVMNEKGSAVAGVLVRNIALLLVLECVNTENHNTD